MLEQSDIKPLALKGPALAVAAYGDISLRQFTDLDLLVHEGEVRKAIEIMLNEGYELGAGYGVADLERSGTYEIVMVKRGALTEIDLHWGLLPEYFPIALAVEDLWQRSVEVEIEGAAIRTLAPNDQFLYLCAHGAKHGWEALGGICDLAELVRNSSIDWDELFSRAERAGARRVLALGALLAHELLEAAVPATLLESALREPPVVRAARSFIGYVSDPADDGPGFYQRWSVRPGHRGARLTVALLGRASAAPERRRSQISAPAGGAAPTVLIGAAVKGGDQRRSRRPAQATRTGLGSLWIPRNRNHTPETETVVRTTRDIVDERRRLQESTFPRTIAGEMKRANTSLVAHYRSGTINRFLVSYGS